MKKASEKQLKTSNILINIIISIYSFINLSHLVWFTMLLFAQ